MDINQQIAQELDIKLWQVEATVKLIDEGNTMKNIQKLSAALVATLLCLNISACQSAEPSTVTTAATMPEAQTRATVSAVQTQGKEDLVRLLDQVEENVFPGTAGSTATAVPSSVPTVKPATVSRQDTPM